MSDRLQEALHRVNREYFGLDELPPIKWSRGQIKKRYRRLTLGAYDISKNEIRIHPLFREKAVPDYVMRFVIFHELLHYEDRRRLKRPVFFGGKRKVHDKSFHERENRFSEKKEAAAYIKKMVRGQFPAE